MASPYVYLGGQLKIACVRDVAEATRCAVSISTNNGRTFDAALDSDGTGADEATIELHDAILRRYAYWLKIEIAAATPGERGPRRAGDRERHPARPADACPGSARAATRSPSPPTRPDASPPAPIACRITPDAKFAKNETTSTMGVVFDNLDVDDGSCWWQGGIGTMTVPIETPGDLVALRFGGQMRRPRRTRRDQDAGQLRRRQDLEGNRQVRRADTRQNRVLPLRQVPPGTKKTLLRYEMTGNNTVGILCFRVDADYKDPLASAAVKPFEVVHRWKENGQEKTNRAKVEKLPFSYKIDAACVPEMVSVTYEMPVK